MRFARTVPGVRIGTYRVQRRANGVAIECYAVVTVDPGPEVSRVDRSSKEGRILCSSRRVVSSPHREWPLTVFFASDPRRR